MRILKSERSQIQSQLVKQRLLQESLLNKERLKYKHAWEEFLVGPKRVHKTVSEGVSKETPPETTTEPSTVLQRLEKKKTRYRSIYETQGTRIIQKLVQEKEIRPPVDETKIIKRKTVAAQPPGEMVVYLEEIA